jgi:ParB family chromosome partitioning protein
MRMLRSKKKAGQLDLLHSVADETVAAPLQDDTQQTGSAGLAAWTMHAPATEPVDGRPLVICIDRIDEDPNNPRVEFPDAELDELAQSIRQHGILQAVVVHPADPRGRYRIHFGAKRYRAAIRAGLQTVPVAVRDAAPDPYAQVAENLKRHSLSPLDLARFIRRRVDAGDSNATVASKLNLDPTTVAHHLTLLALPPMRDDALKSGRCTSPRTLHEPHRLHAQNPDQVQALLASNGDITRKAIATVKATALTIARDPDREACAATSLMARAAPMCDHLQAILERATRSDVPTPADQLAALHSRLMALTELAARRSPRGVGRSDPHVTQGSDRQTATGAGGRTVRPPSPPLDPDIQPEEE